MAEITFLAIDDDYDAIWEMVFGELRLTAYPDSWFGDLPAPALKDPADVSANLAQYPRVAPGLSYFLISSEWSIEPLDYVHCDKNPNFAPHWYVRQRYGGPSIHFIPSFGYPRHMTSRQIVSGMFGDYPYFFSTVDGSVIKRPTELVATMKTIRQRLRSQGKAVRAPTGQRAIAMNGALRAYGAGAVLRTGSIIYAPLASSLGIKRGM